MMVDQRIYTNGEFIGMVDLDKMNGPREVPLPEYWCILQVHPGRETKVMKTFRQRNISGWLPLMTNPQTVRRYKRGYEYLEQKNVTSPLITGAVVIPDFELARGQWRSVDACIGVYRMGDCIVRLLPKHMTDLRNIEAISNTPKSKRDRLFAIGELVRVTAGPFAHFSARVERFDSKGRLSVGVDIFGLITPVEMNESEIEKV